MKQRARELGAIASGLVRPGVIFDSPVLEPWADQVSDAEAKADLAAKEARSQAEAALPHDHMGGVIVKPGKSEVARPGHRKARRASQAET